MSASPGSSSRGVCRPTEPAENGPVIRVINPGGSLSVRAQPRAALGTVHLTGEGAPTSSDRALGLGGNFTWTLAGNVAYAATQWGLLVVLVKLGSPALVGQFALGLAICAPVFFLTRLSLRSVQATDARRKYELGHYLALRLVTVPVALCLVALIVFVVDYRPELASVIGAVAIAKAVECLGDPFYGVFQQQERMDHVSKSLITKGLLGLVAFTAVFGLVGHLAWSVVAVAMACGTVFLLYDCRVAPSFSTTRPIWEPRALMGLARLALPLGAAAMLLSLNSNLPRYFVERFLGEYEIGVYAALAYPVVALGMVFNAMGQAASPRLARLYSGRETGAYTRLLIQLAAFGVAIGAASLATATFFGREILARLYQPEYAHHVDLFLWFLAAFVLSCVSSSLGYGLTATRSFRLQPALFATSALVACLCSYFLIPRYGLDGAVWACCAALGVQVVGGLICHFIVFRRASHAV